MGGVTGDGGGLVDKMQQMSVAENEAPTGFRADELDLPEEILKRVRALRKNQKEIIEIEINFYKELHELETKYEHLYKEKFEKRRDWVTGESEPTEEEADFPILLSILGLDGEEFKTMENVKGIPDFWLRVFENNETLGMLIEENDGAVLKHLLDVKCESTEDPLGFKIYFYFSPNEYFENDVLVKTYVMKNEPDLEYPLSYDGPEFLSCEGCEIKWKPGKDLTTRTIQKRQKHKRTGLVRLVKKQVKNDTFFNFFNPPKPLNLKTADEKEDIRDELIMETLHEDFAVGRTFRERIIPRALLYFTGEAEDDDNDDDEESETDVTTTASLSD